MSTIFQIILRTNKRLNLGNVKFVAIFYSSESHFKRKGLGVFDIPQKNTLDLLFKPIMVSHNIFNVQKFSRVLPSLGNDNDNVRSISVPNSKLVMTCLSKKWPKPFSIITNS